MAIRLDKQGTASSHAAVPPEAALAPPSLNASDAFCELIATSHPVGYCDAGERQALIREGARLGLDVALAETMLDLELDRLGVASEAALLERLDATLRLFTDKDHTLDDKERRDALHLVCKPAGGHSQGLRHDIADRYVTQFCRERKVKVKVGLFRWAVPLGTQNAG